MKILNVASDDSDMGKTRVHEWYICVSKMGVRMLKMMRALDVPAHINNRCQRGKSQEKIRMDDRRISVRDVTDDVGMSIGLCPILRMKGVSANFFPKFLNFKQKLYWVKKELLKENSNNSNYSNLITSDETWIY